MQNNLKDLPLELNPIRKIKKLEKFADSLKIISKIRNLKISQKIINDYDSRGWNDNLIITTIKNPFTTRKALNKANNNSATVYYQKNGAYVSVDDKTNEVIQISKIGDENWIPDNTIINPYKP